MEGTTYSNDNNTDKEWGGKYDTSMVPLFLILLDADVLMLLIFYDAV